MGCKGSIPAEEPKSEAANSTLSTIPKEPKGEAPATQASAPETTPKEVVANAPAEKVQREFTFGCAPSTTTQDVVGNAAAKKAEESSKEAPADAITAKAEEAVETQDAPKSALDATETKAEEVKTEEAATEEASATGLPTQASNDETTSPDEVPIATEKMVAEKIAEADTASKADVPESSVSVAAADAPVASKHGGCLSYCTATEAQTEIVVQN